MKAKYMNKFNKYLNNLFSIHLTEAAPFFCLRSPSRRSLSVAGSFTLRHDPPCLSLFRYSTSLIAPSSDLDVKRDIKRQLL